MSMPRLSRAAVSIARSALHAVSAARGITIRFRNQTLPFRKCWGDGQLLAYSTYLSVQVQLRSLHPKHDILAVKADFLRRFIADADRQARFIGMGFDGVSVTISGSLVR